MAVTRLKLSSPFVISHSCPFFTPSNNPYHHKNLIFFLIKKNTQNYSPLSYIYSTKSPAIGGARASVSETPKSDVAENEKEDDGCIVLDDEMISRVSRLKEASEVLEMITEKLERDGGKKGGVVSCNECRRLISAALESCNSDLALSVFAAMRSSSFSPVSKENGGFVENWKWSRPDLSIYTTLVLGLAASLRVSDALKMVSDICRVGASPGEEVPFGKIVRCPTCLIAVAVAQPQQGIQVVSCAKCRYKYELVSGDIVNIDSEEISMDVPALKRWLGFLQIMKQTIPSAVHSIVIQTPSGVARTHRFATETPDVPAQPGERVTIALAAPSSVDRELGPFRFSPKAPKYYSAEPLYLTNHRDGRESLLLRAPSTNSKVTLLNPSIFIPLAVVLASGDAASGIINPNLPQLLPVAAVASLAVGATFNTMVLPQLGQIMVPLKVENQKRVGQRKLKSEKGEGRGDKKGRTSELPQRLVDTVAIKQQLLAQYDMLQSRIKDLKDSAENEVWMLARMCQLENKIFAVGEPSYRARRNRIKRVRESLENSLRGRMELIDSYARISSMIEIEVEMDTDVLAAEASSNAESIAKQIQQIMELENLEERWRVQAEANDEVERLLRSEPLSTEQL